MLIDALWDRRAPATAASALRVHITQVRRALEPDRDASANARLPLLPSGYVLRVGPEELDSQRFESLVIAGRESNALGDPVTAERQIRAALELWRGPPLADAEGLSAVAAEATRLEELRVSAIEELAEACLTLCQHTALVDLLADAVAEFPLHEKLAARLMLALYRCGRQADALRAYATLARQLDQQLGIEPSARLRQLEEDILLQRSHLEHSPRTAAQDAEPQFGGPRRVGRRAELGRLLEALTEAANRQRSCILLSGPAGIGKTTVVAEFCARARNLGAAVFAGQCTDDGVDRSIADIFSAVTPELDGIGTADPELPSPDGRGDLPSFEGVVNRDLESEQLRWFEEIAAAIRHIDRPVVLVVEDLHWASRTTLLVLRHLLRLSDLDQLLVVTTARDEDADADLAERLTELAPSARTTLVPLEGLNDHEVRALIRTLPDAGEALIDLAPTIRGATDGNPFFIRELLRDISACSTDDRINLEARIMEAAPSGVRALIDRRIARVSRGARHVLEAAATLGGDFSLEIVADVCDLSTDSALEGIEELLARRLLVEKVSSVDSFAFQHALVRNAVHTGVADFRRSRLHRRAGEALEARWPDAASCAEVAHHFWNATAVGQVDKASVWAERAGAEAAQRFAFAEAAEWYERALLLRTKAGSPPTGALYLACGLACDGAREPSKARAAYLEAAECAREARDAILLADIAIAATPAWTSGLEPQPEAERLLEDALEALGGRDSRRRIQLLSRLATLLHYANPDHQNCVAQEGRALAEQLTDGTSIAVAALAHHLWLTHEPEARRERLDIAQGALAAAHEDATTQLRVGRELLADLLENGEIESFDRQLEVYEAQARRHASARDSYWSMALRATQATLRGELPMAEQLSRGALLKGHDLHQDAYGAELLQRFVLRYQQGRLSELVTGLRKTTQMQAAYRAGTALAATACAETGRVDEGARIARWALGPDGKEIQKDVLWIGAHALLAGVAARASDRSLARLLDELIAPCSDHIVVFGAGGAVLGSAHYWRGLLAATLKEFDRAVDHLEEARRVAQGMSAPFWTAQAEIDLAGVLARHRRGANHSAIDKLTESAVATAQERGFGRILTQASMR